MILFTRSLMPAELRLQSDRETQKSEIYFTNHTLTGKLDAFPWLGSDTARRFRRPAVRIGFVRRVLGNFISPITL